VKKGSKRGVGRPLATDGLIVWGERWEEPDWDGYVKALLNFAMSEVDLKGKREDLARVLRRVGERKHGSATSSSGVS
jgi:hypothetical protein